MRAKIIIAIRNFFRTYGRTIGIIFGIWLAIFMVNKYLESRPQEIELQMGHNLDTPIMDETGTVPKKAQTKIKELTQSYFDSCSSKKYDEAWNMLSDSCKSYVFEDDIEEFKLYIDDIYQTENKIYTLQNYSNVGTTYVYIFTVLDNIEETGTTGGFDIYEEKMSFIKTDDTYKISCKNYIQNEKIEKEQEDNFLKVIVESKDETYEVENYNLRVTNKTSSEMVIADKSGEEQVELVLSNQYREATNIVQGDFDLAPGESKNMTFTFPKYFDDDNVPSELRLNTVKIYNEETGELVKKYSFNIKLK